MNFEKKFQKRPAIVLLICTALTTCLYLNLYLCPDLSNISGHYTTLHVTTPIILTDDYLPSKLEDYFVKNAIKLGYDLKTASGCDIWRSTFELQRDLKEYLTNLEQYSSLVMRRISDSHHIKDVRTEISSNHVFCDSIDVHPGGVQNIFYRKQLSVTQKGYVEPMLPQLRHPKFCGMNGPDYSKILDLSFLVHDFANMCRSITSSSKTIFIDMGASLDFHGNTGKSPFIKPAIYLQTLYNAFGFKFDHIYAFEMKQQHPKDVFEMVPREIFSSYHWINVGVSADPSSKMNPLSMVLDNFNSSDLVIVKLDIDTFGVEAQFIKQILNDNKLCELIDQFYFEHHVSSADMDKVWGSKFPETTKDSLDLFTSLRQCGVPAHYWV